MDDNTQQNNPWLNLSTVTSFDRGELQTTRYSNNVSQLQKNNRAIDRISPAFSLLTETLVELICRVLETDSTKSRKLYLAICTILHEMQFISNSYETVELDLTRNNFQKKLLNLIKLTHLSINSDNALQISKYREQKWSRYSIEFEETGFIAAGGFGKVYKAINRLDGIEYAIKKIIIRINKFNQNQFDEVKTLAKLNHSNIVPYKSAWIEEMSPLCYERCDENQLCLTHRISHESFSEENREIIISDFTNLDEKSTEMDESKNSSSIYFKNDEMDEITKSNRRRLNSKNNEDTCDFINNTTECKQLCQYDSFVHLQHATLYIQMALCEKTLREWLDERDGTTPMLTIMSITTQILEGLNYIHSCNVVHHDIKPSNIFISTFTNGIRVQLGDFGLACALQKSSHHSAQGTHMYAAPEQLNGECNPKSDLYSLGIILLELLVPMKTVMERSRLIELLKADMIPKEIIQKYPEWTQILSELTRNDPNLRPSADQLLENLKKDKDLLIIKLINVKKKQSNLIKSLQDKIDSLEAEIMSLKTNSISLKEK